QGLAPVKPMLLGLPLFGELRQLASKVDQVLVALGPVAEERELLADCRLGLGSGGFQRERGRHGRVLLFHCRRQRTPAGVSSSRMPSLASWSRISSARLKSRFFFARLRSSTRAWIRLSSLLSAPRANQSAGACCRRPSARPAPSSSPFRRFRSAGSSALRASAAIRAISASAWGVLRSSSRIVSMLAGI